MRRRGNSEHSGVLRFRRSPTPSTRSSGASLRAARSLTFLHEAAECYRQGLFAAALSCAHATCEQELAGRVAHRPQSAPAGWQRWGLGKLIEHAEREGWHTPDVIALLKATNENRRSVYHLRDLSAPDSLFHRAYEREPWVDKDEIKS